MKDTLIRYPHIELRKSKIHGYGVFATQDIPSDTILEEVPFLEIPTGVANNYAFVYPKYDTPEPGKSNTSERCVLPHGISCIYNHSDTYNVSWTTDTKNEIFVFYTVCGIKKDEELFIYYGTPEAYWSHYPDIEKK